MNNTSEYIFQLYHYLLNLRDTLEFTVDHPHPLAAYEQRKRVLTTGITDGTALGNFLNNNAERGDKIRENLQTLINELYSDDSKILVPERESDNVRVDYSQNIHIFDLVVGNAEAVRDIIYGYLKYASEHNELEQDITNLIACDEHLYRCVLDKVLLNEYQKSFAEFQKVMGENGGQPSPQANYIVQNELNKLASMIRFSRSHTHTTDNKSLDEMDDIIKVIEMCEGRRERTQGKTFPDLFKEVVDRNEALIAEYEPQWREIFQKLFNQAVEAEKARTIGQPKEDLTA